MISSIFNFVLIALGFGLVIVIHELGHFLAARWAGIRVHAFAVGFGPALFSWRKGMGLRRGSSEPEYLKVTANAPAISTTEYRLNVIPFGGYVKMLGQDDADPTAVSNSPDSFTAKPVWKRMIVISAGVIMNIILAALLFIVVFMAGMKEVAPVIGDVDKGFPAAAAGVMPGDAVTSIDGTPIRTFTDIQIAAAMASPNEPLSVSVLRTKQGASQPEAVQLTIRPEVGGTMKLMQIGVGPAQSADLFEPPTDEKSIASYRKLLDEAGLKDVPLGASLVEVNSKPIGTLLVDGQQIRPLSPLIEAISNSNGQPVNVAFAPAQAGQPVKSTGAALVRTTIRPQAQLQTAFAAVQGEGYIITHLLGIAPVMKVAEFTDEPPKQDLKPGDIFARIGGRDWPDITTGINEIRSNSGGALDLRVLRGGAFVDLRVEVSRDGRVGFAPDEATDTAFITAAPALFTDKKLTQPLSPPPAASTLSPAIAPGMKITRVGTTPVSSFRDIREAIRNTTKPGQAAELQLSLLLLDPGSATQGREEKQTLKLTADDTTALHGLGWVPPTLLPIIFEPAQILIKADSPLQAIGMGITKTHRVLTMTYLTFARLFQGTVKVEHLKGPVGIADVGAKFAAEGFIYLLFFLGLISANLAVINFLPLPIVDGGLFIMLLIEGITKRPVPIVVQNVVTIVGMVLIGTLFLIVTANDVMNLFH